MITYKAEGTEFPAIVLVINDDPATETGWLNPRNDLFNHSPDGFAWGYGGSGAAQLALAILAHHLGDDELALRHHQRFKQDVVAQAPMDERFEATTNEIRLWLLTQQGGGRG